MPGYSVATMPDHDTGQPAPMPVLRAVLLATTTRRGAFEAFAPVVAELAGT